MGEGGLKEGGAYKIFGSKAWGLIRGGGGKRGGGLIRGIAVRKAGKGTDARTTETMMEQNVKYILLFL